MLRGTFHVVSLFPLLFMLYRGNLEYFSNSGGAVWDMQDSNPEPLHAAVWQATEVATTYFLKGVCHEIF